MEDKELRKLSRSELLEMLIATTKENEELHQQLEAQTEELNEKKLTISKAGSIAEASLQLNGVFQAAEDAAEQYLYNIKNCDQICDTKISEAEEQAEKILKEAEEKAASLEEEAQKKADSYWEEVSQRLEKFYADHDGLQELLKMPSRD